MSVKGVYETDNWRSGKKRSRAPGYVPPEPETVTIVLGRATALKFFGCRNDTELERHLRELRDRGMLICSGRRLQNWVRVDDPSGVDGVRHVRGYVVRGHKKDVPTMRKEHATAAKGGRLGQVFTV
jgi:hypothetical protein